MDSWPITEEVFNYLSGKGVNYADVRVTQSETQDVTAGNAKAGSVEFREDSGFGVRVLLNGAWGYAASAELSMMEARKVAAMAIEVAKASAILQNRAVFLAELPVYIDEYRTPFQEDPFLVPAGERMEMLISATAAATAVMDVSSASGFISCRRDRTWFASLPGSRIFQEILICGANITVQAGGRRDMQTRSFPSSHGGDTFSGGFEGIRRLDLAGHAAQTASEAVALLKAPVCPAGTFDIILSGDQLSMQLHESVGHPLELDRIFGAEANFSGTSFVDPGLVNRFPYASKVVNITSDPTKPDGLGSYKYDDDGVPASRVNLITDGILTGFLSGRETASRVKMESSANNRADGWRNFPINRMSNTVLLPGKWRFEDLLADTESGLYLVTNKSWSIDDRRENFRFECEMAMEISGGKLGRIYKNPVYSGKTVPFWMSCDAVCNKDYFRMWGTPNCGKGEPSQSMYTSQGAAPARFRGVRLGDS